jgi:hypothetical protein
VLALAQPAVPDRPRARNSRWRPAGKHLDLLPDHFRLRRRRAVYTWEREGDNYRIAGEAEAEGFFTLFLEARSARKAAAP